MIAVNTKADLMAYDPSTFDFVTEYNKTTEHDHSKLKNFIGDLKLVE